MSFMWKTSSTPLLLHYQQPCNQHTSFKFPQGFFYNKYPEPKKGELGTETDINLNQQLCYHVVGQPQRQDAVILACPDHPAWQQGAEVTDDGRSAFCWKDCA